MVECTDGDTDTDGDLTYYEHNPQDIMDDCLVIATEREETMRCDECGGTGYKYLYLIKYRNAILGVCLDCLKKIQEEQQKEY